MINSIHIKEYILDVVDLSITIPQSRLIKELESVYPENKQEEFLLALSELTQSNLIKRYEYTVKDHAERRVFYMPVTTRLAF